MRREYRARADHVEGTFVASAGAVGAGFGSETAQRNVFNFGHKLRTLGQDNLAVHEIMKGLMKWSGFKVTNARQPAHNRATPSD